MRKVRMAAADKGKSGSIRVIYYRQHAQRIYLLLAYPKSHRDTLSASELEALKALTRQLKEKSHDYFC
ncbi:type II toxin-antitoxin system RelE/ParE family toxin [Pseudomonas sp. C27(2019)]|uniref:type II toxin-antitoxin system RelE/ParE family toxin n=1 Tax=Pseudomonas sp. C27(2019) TaxID=2604941 RepID=UPI0021158E10|nr:type II toxin-antitoxin system RelE/ParE family toxin [Pseudomonas sp. C27(2019)]